MAARLTAEFLKDWKNGVNPDLQKERDTCNFNIQELTYILDGGVENTRERHELQKLIFEKNSELFSFKKRPFKTKSEVYEDAVAKSVKLFQWKRELNWSVETFELANKIVNYDIALSLHHTMFIPALERLATDEQKSTWLPLAQSYQIIGTYAQTELGHGTNLMELETTATFDASTDEFVMNTPRLSSMKWWPGGLGKSCNHAVVLAQLVINQKKHGLHPFMVQLRSLEDHMPMPGIKVGDIGPKLGGNNIDNGYLMLNHLRIPRRNMLMKNATVTRQGKFTQLAGNKANYATMILVRVKIMGWAEDALKQAAIVTIRYSAVRRQTTLKPGSPEQQVLDFQTQQHKAFPALAAAFAFHAVAKTFEEEYNASHAQIMAGNTSKLAELHAQSAGLKGLLSDMATMMIEVCRRSCGGHGYLLASGVAENMASSLPLVTVEGENTVMYLQTSRYLMKQMANAVSGTKTTGPTAYMNRDYNAYTCPIETSQDCHNLDKLRELFIQRAHRQVLSVAQKLQMDMESGEPQEVVFNKNMVLLVAAAKAHLQLTVVDLYINSLRDQLATCSAPLGKALQDVCTFYVVHDLIANVGDFLEMETVGLSQTEWLRQEEFNLLAMIRPNAVGLTDAFDLHDESVASDLGRYDGNAYQHLYESTQYEPMNQTEVHPAYYKHLRALIKGSTTAKL